MCHWPARPAIASPGILLAVWSWNQFLLALVLVEDPSERTMAGSLGAFHGHYATDILLCAGTILILCPRSWSTWLCNDTSSRRCCRVP